MDLPLHPILEDLKKERPDCWLFTTDKGAKRLLLKNSCLHNFEPFYRARVRYSLKHRFTLYGVYDIYLEWCLANEKTPISFDEFKLHMEERHGKANAPYYMVPFIMVYSVNID